MLFSGFWRGNQTFFLERAEGGVRGVGFNFLAVDDQGTLLDVGFEDLAGLSLGERNVVAVQFTFAGDFADCHRLFLLYGINDCFESFRVVDGEVGKDFAVKLDTFLLQTSDELGIGKAEFAGSIVDASNPEGTKVALFVPAVAIRVAKRFDNALFGETVAAGAVMLHTFGGSKDFLVFGMGRNATFDSHD